MALTNDSRIASFVEKFSKLEHFLMGLMLIGFVGEAQNWGIPDALFIMSLGILACLYFLRGVIIVDTDFSRMERFINKQIYFSMVTGLVAFLFQVMSWPKWEPLAITALAMFCVAFVLLLIKRLLITKFLTTIELSTIVLVLIYFAKIFMS